MNAKRLSFAALAALGGSPALAQSVTEERMNNLRKAFTHQIEKEPYQSSGLTLVFAFVLGGLALWVSGYALVQWRRGRGLDDRPRLPMRFFNQTLRDMGVSWSERALLRKAARAMDLPQPCVMLMEPRLFEQFAGKWADSLPSESMRRRARARMERVAQKTFGCATAL